MNPKAEQERIGAQITTSQNGDTTTFENVHQRKKEESLTIQARGKGGSSDPYKA